MSKFHKVSRILIVIILIHNVHCVKDVSDIQPEYRKMRTRKNPVFGHFSRSGNNYVYIKRVELSSLFSLPTLYIPNIVRTTFENVNTVSEKSVEISFSGIFFDVSPKNVFAIGGSGENLREFNFKA